MQESYDETDRERKELQDRFSDIIVKVERAQVLSASLGDEQVCMMLFEKKIDLKKLLNRNAGKKHFKTCSRRVCPYLVMLSSYLHSWSMAVVFHTLSAKIS